MEDEVLCDSPCTQALCWTMLRLLYFTTTHTESLPRSWLTSAWRLVVQVSSGLAVAYSKCRTMPVDESMSMMILEG